MLATTSAASTAPPTFTLGKVPHRIDEPLPGDHTHPRQAVEHHQRDGGQQQHPQQLIAVVGASTRIGGDAGRIVVGESGQQAGADDGEQRCQLRALELHRRALRLRRRRCGQTPER